MVMDRLFETPYLITFLITMTIFLFSQNIVNNLYQKYSTNIVCTFLTNKSHKIYASRPEYILNVLL